jgi:hypothetical protein
VSNATKLLEKSEKVKTTIIFLITSFTNKENNLSNISINLSWALVSVLFIINHIA